MALTISSKGWVVIPAELRKKYNLRPGAKVTIVDYGGVLSIMPVPGNAIKELRGALKGGPSLTKELLKERAADREREEARIRRFNG
jgi:AbrB family looped-hinge helix DNA binding protein